MGNTRKRTGKVSKQKIRLVAAILIFVLGFVLRFLTITGMQFSFYLCCGTSFFLLVWCGVNMLEQSRIKTLGHALKALLTLFLLAGSAVFLVAEAFVLSGARTTINVQADCLLILGAGVDGTVPSLILQSRLEAAQSYWEIHPSIPIVVSGGQGAGEDISEAKAMQTYLINHGIPENCIYLEDQSRNTEENMQYSKALMEKEHIPHETVAVVSNEFHLYRARILAEDVGLQTIGVSAKTPYLILKINYFIREAFALLQQTVFH